MGTTREGSAGAGAHEYTCGPFTVMLMGNDLWQVFERRAGGVLHDTGEDYFSTLAKARKWCRSAIVARVDASIRAEGRPAIRDYSMDTLRLWLKEKVGTTYPKAKTLDEVTQKVWFAFEASK